jgi:hypothetical protein
MKKCEKYEKCVKNEKLLGCSTFSKNSIRMRMTPMKKIVGVVDLFSNKIIELLVDF